jgi:hypothetical protein
MKTILLNLFLITASSVFSQLSLNVESTNPTCKGGDDGAITIYIVGGTAPYTINGMEYPNDNYSFHGLSVGNYEMIVTDANDQAVTSIITLSEPQIPSISSMINHASTNLASDGSIDITISSSNDYSVVWVSESDYAFTVNGEDISDLKPGTYTMRLTYNGICFESFNYRVKASKFILNPMNAFVNESTTNSEDH